MYQLMKRPSSLKLLLSSQWRFARSAETFLEKFIVITKERWLICLCRVWRFGYFAGSGSSFVSMKNAAAAFSLNG